MRFGTTWDFAPDSASFAFSCAVWTVFIFVKSTKSAKAASAICDLISCAREIFSGLMGVPWNYAVSRGSSRRPGAIVEDSVVRLM